MKNLHTYSLFLQWDGKNIIKNSPKNERLYSIKIEGKPVLKGSADEVFYGDPTLYNPEDLLLSALSSCHMMSFFYVCRKHKIEVKDYSDQPIGTLKVNIDGSGQFEKVVLQPKVILANKKDLEKTESLHKEAGKLCFIANSCNFLIEYAPSFEV